MRGICRRVWLLRSEGRSREAQRIEDTELAAAAAQARDALGNGLEADARFNALLAEERERMAAAMEFAEILAPMLSERLRAQAPVRGRAGMASDAEGPETSDPGEARGIADYIDQMLAQERSDSR